MEEPPGLNSSSFAIRVHSRSLAVRSSRTIGVLPIRSTSESATSIGGPGSEDGADVDPGNPWSDSSGIGSSVNSSVGSPARRRRTATGAASATGP